MALFSLCRIRPVFKLLRVTPRTLQLLPSTLNFPSFSQVLKMVSGGGWGGGWGALATHKLGIRGNICISFMSACHSSFAGNLGCYQGSFKLQQTRAVLPSHTSVIWVFTYCNGGQGGWGGGGVILWICRSCLWTVIGLVFVAVFLAHNMGFDWLCDWQHGNVQF